MKIVKNRKEYYAERYRNASKIGIDEFIKVSNEDMNIHLVPQVIEVGEAFVLGFMLAGVVFSCYALFYLCFMTNI